MMNVKREEGCDIKTGFFFDLHDFYFSGCFYVELDIAQTLFVARCDGDIAETRDGCRAGEVAQPRDALPFS